MIYRRANTQFAHRQRSPPPIPFLSCMSFVLKPWIPIPSRVTRREGASRHNVVHASTHSYEFKDDTVFASDGTRCESCYEQVTTDTTVIESLIGGESMDDIVIKPRMSGILSEALVAVSLSQAELARTA